MFRIDRKSFLQGWLLCVCCLQYATVDSSETIYKLEKGEKEVPGWGINVRRVTSEYIDPVRDTTIISGWEICQDPKTEIVIVIESTPEGRKIRDAIRQSWGRLTEPHKVKIGFIIGSPRYQYFQNALELESMRYKDIIEESFIEAYYNLTLKGIFILKWFVRTCPNAKFLLKADEDTFVDVRLLVHRLASYSNSTGILRGYLCSNFDRDDRLWSKWYAPRYMYKYNKYPDFLQGSAYYMSRDVAVKLFAAAMFIPVFHLEDVYITGLCAKRARVKPSKDGGVEYLFGSPIGYCLLPHIITCNSVPSSELDWVLSERSKLINYSNIEKDPSTSTFESTIEDNSYDSYPEELSTEVMNLRKMQNEIQTSNNLSLVVKPRSEDVSGAIPSIFVEDRTMRYFTWFSVWLIFHWHHTLLH